MRTFSMPRVDKTKFETATSVPIYSFVGFVNGQPRYRRSGSMLISTNETQKDSNFNPRHGGRLRHPVSKRFGV
jgi:hypothetical protein